MIEAAVSNPCDGLSIAQVFPPGVVAGDSFLVLGCGFGRQPVALVDAAIGQARTMDYWSENLIQAPHPGGAAAAQLRVVTGSGDATERFPVTTTGVPMGGMFPVHPSWVDAINGDFFWWEDIGADEYLVKLRALGAVRATERQATTGALEDMTGKQETASKRRWAIRLGLGMALAAAAAGGAAWWRSTARLVREQRLVGRMAGTCWVFGRRERTANCRRRTSTRARSISRRQATGAKEALWQSVSSCGMSIVQARPVRSAIYPAGTG